MTTPPAKGNVKQVVWDLPSGEPQTLDPAKSFAAGNNLIDSNMCDSLLRLTPDYKYEPGLATSWTYSADHLTLTYTLRKDVKFWDGHPLTSADVVYSLLRNVDPKVEPVNSSIYANVKTITADGPNKVVVHFKRKDELFNHEMSVIPGEISEKSYVEAQGSKYGTATGGIMCSGPYELTKWNSGSDMVFKANDTYWDPSLRPKAQSLIVKFISDTGTLVQALKSGEIDGAYEIPATSLPSLKSASSGTVFLGQSPTSIFLNATGAAATDPKIRKALSLVIDRSAIASKIFDGAATPSYTLMTPSWWDPDALPIYRAAYKALKIPTSPDPDAAKKLLSGDPNVSKPIAVYVRAGDTTETNTLALIQQEAAAVGLHVQVKAEPPATVSNLVTNSSFRKKSGASFFWDPTYTDVPDPLDNLLYTVLPPAYGGSLEYVKYDNQEQVASLLKQAQAAFDATQRAKLITKAQTIWEKQDQLDIPIVSQPNVLFMNKKITGAPASFSSIFLPSLAMIGAAN